jgi:hypothetical protein
MSMEMIIHLSPNQMRGEKWGLVLPSTLLPRTGLCPQARFFQRADPYEPQGHRFTWQPQGLWPLLEL